MTLKGSHYPKGCIVLLNSSPTFGQLLDILIFNVDEVLFTCEVLKTVHFVPHFHAYEVCREKPCPLVFCKQNDFADDHVLGVYSIDNCMYIVPKYNIEY